MLAHLREPEPTRPITRIGLFGAGNVARCVAPEFASMDTVELSGFAGCSNGKAEQFERDFQLPFLALKDLIDKSDLIVEASAPGALPEFVPSALKQGRNVVILSVNGLIENPWIMTTARESSGRLIMACGAIAGLDAILSAALGEVKEARLKTSKPPSAFPNIFDGNEVLSAPELLFRGSAREASLRFPKNTNVAASIALAAFDEVTGPDRVQVEVWADPSLTSNRHEIEVTSDTGSIRTCVDNVPCRSNPATSALAANSVVSAVKKLLSPCTFL